MAGRPTKQSPSPTAARLAPAIGAHFLRRRNQLGETQKQFAVHMGMTQNQISEIEAGLSNPKLSTLEIWADKLRMDVAKLVRSPGET